MPIDASSHIVITHINIEGVHTVLHTAVRKQGDFLVAFFVLTFAITWGLGAFVMLLPNLSEALFGKLSAASPVFILAVAGPTIAASILTFVRDGWSGLRSLYAHWTKWGFGLQWYALLFIAIPLINYLISRVAGHGPVPNLNTLPSLLGFLILQFILGPLGEELGWHGFAFPRLLKRYNPLTASLIFGIIWGVWHLPAFFLSGLPQSDLGIPVFLVRATFLAILAAWIFLRTGRNVPSMVLFHFMINVSLDMFGVPQLPLMVVTMVAAVLVIVLDRRVGWFSKDVTEDVWAGSALVSPAVGG
jgi:membrane protease YdiL (CAAX protease family)